MNALIHPAIQKYASGELSAGQAADLLGVSASVADVIVMARSAGLEPPRQSPEDAAAELARARALLGITPR
jgi:predicted HTH domain antitoxin